MQWVRDRPCLNQHVFVSIYDTAGLWKNRLWSDVTRSVRRLVRTCTFCHMKICIKHISRFLYNYEYAHIERTNIGKNCLLFQRPGFLRRSHTCLHYGFWHDAIVNSETHNFVGIFVMVCWSVWLLHHISHIWVSYLIYCNNNPHI